MGYTTEIWGLLVTTYFAQCSLAERLSTFHEEVFLGFAYIHTHARAYTHTPKFSPPVTLSQPPLLPSTPLSHFVIIYLICIYLLLVCLTYRTVNSSWVGTVADLSGNLH